MNPWSFYEQKPQLVQALVVGVTAWLARRRRLSSAPAALATMAATAWALIGVFDWFVYSFGHQIASWTVKDTQSISEMLGWLQVVVVAIGAAAVMRHLRGAPPAA